AVVEAAGIVRTTLGRGGAGPSSRLNGRTLGPGSGPRGATPTPSSSSGSSTRPRYTIARRHIAAIELPSFSGVPIVADSAASIVDHRAADRRSPARRGRSSLL